MGISLTWWFPVNICWKIKWNLFILCLVLPNNHNYFQNKTKHRPLDILVTFKALPNPIFPATISKQEEKNHVFVLMSHTDPQGPASPLLGTPSGIFDSKTSFLMFFVTIITFNSFFALTCLPVPAQTLWMYFCEAFWGEKVPQDNKREVSNILNLPEEATELFLTGICSDMTILIYCFSSGAH